MKKLVLLSLLIVTFSNLSAQVGIETTTPHPKSALEISSKNNNTGVLFPRLTTTQINTISPANGDTLVDGLMVYNTDTKCYNYWAAEPRNVWLQICGTGAITNKSSATSTTGQIKK